MFGDIDENKTAAQKLQKLKQVRSVCEHTTELQGTHQTLTAQDEQALIDKFTEGLKMNVQNLLISSLALKNGSNELEILTRNSGISNPISFYLTNKKQSVKKDRDGHVDTRES